MTVRPSAVAGLFYPADPLVLRDDVERLLGTDFPGAVTSDTGTVPKALIAPHAGYKYSGPVAASAYALLQPVRDVVTRVILLGPAHRVRFAGLAASSATDFATPLGNVPLDVSGVEAITALPQVHCLDEAHAAEHSLEVHLPFLQVALKEFRINPIVVGDASAAEVAEVIDLLWGGPETLIVVSTDLSHFNDHITAQQIDRTTVELIESLRVDELTGQRACGFLPICGLLEGVRRHGLSIKAIDLRDSSQTAGDPSRGCRVRRVCRVLRSFPNSNRQFSRFSTMPIPALTAEHRRTLLQVAARSVELAAADPERPLLAVVPEQHAPELRRLRSSFVTLHRDGKLRGCRGSILATEPLVVNVAHSARAAAFFDERFPVIDRDEIPELNLHISVLGTPTRMSVESEAELLSSLRIGIDGLIIREGSRQALFLPSVWEKLPKPQLFVEHLKSKAGLPEHYWSSTIICQQFAVEEFEATAGDCAGNVGG